MGQILNIKANFHFFNSLITWIFNEFSGNEGEISNLSLIFPNKRSCREFNKAFLEHSKLINKAIEAPKSMAIADISIYDLYKFLPQKEVKSLALEMEKMKKIGGIDYIFFLSEEIMRARFFENMDFSQIIGFASSLKALFDEIEKHEIDIEKLYQIDDSNLSEHRQFSLEFLKSLYVNVKNKTLRDNILSETAWQNHLIKNFSALIDEFGLSSRLIIAGSTGSVKYSKKLIKSISGQDNGYVFLYGYNENCQFADFEKSSQHIIHSLVKAIEVESGEVKNVSYCSHELSSEKRREFLDFALIPSEKSYIWSEKSCYSVELAEDLSKNIKYFQAENEVKEAEFVVRQAFKGSEMSKKVAIIVNSDNFAKLAISEMQKRNIEFNDVRSSSLKDSKLINLFLLLIELIETDFESSILLSVFKHKYFNLISEEKLLAAFEIEILRSQRNSLYLNGIFDKVQNSSPEIQEFFNKFYEIVKILQIKSKKVNFVNILNNLILVSEKISGCDFKDLIAKEKASQEISELIEKLRNHGNLIIKSDEILEFFRKVFAHISFFKEAESDAKIQILSPIEARLLNFDLVIVTSLNHGKYPQVQSDNLLGKKIRKELAVDFFDRKYGQNMYDFCNYFANSSVILTRPKSVSGSLCLPSALISRLEIVLKKNNLYLDEIFVKNENISKNRLQQSFSSPKISKIGQLKALAATDIANLVKDPYRVYAKKILKLQKLDEIDYQPSYKEFGSFVHKTLEEFIKNKQGSEEFLEKAKNIFNQYFISKDAKLIWWPKFQNIFSDFVVKNKTLKAKQNFAEILAKIEISSTEIFARIDRVMIDEGQKISIIDYKTGSSPAKKDVISLSEPQLLIYALMLKNGSFKFVEKGKISSLKYWNLSSFGSSSIVESVKEGEIDEILSKAEKSLENLLNFYQNEDNSYKIAKNQVNLHEYSHLERVF